MANIDDRLARVETTMDGEQTHAHQVSQNLAQQIENAMARVTKQENKITMLEHQVVDLRKIDNVTFSILLFEAAFADSCFNAVPFVFSQPTTQGPPAASQDLLLARPQVLSQCRQSKKNRHLLLPKVMEVGNPP